MTDKFIHMSYRNILVFTICLAATDFVLLLTLFSSYKPFVITALVGGITAIIYILVVIGINAGRLANRNNEARRRRILFASCPDYFAKRTVSGGREICANEHVYTDAVKNSYIMKAYPEDTDAETFPFPKTHDYEFKGSEPKHEKFWLREIESHPEVQTNVHKCAPLYVSPTEPKMKALRGYNRVPWTTQRGKCSLLQV
jgi:hypothetical protein